MVRPVYSTAQSIATMVLTDEIIVRCDAGAAADIAAEFNLGVGRQFEWLGPNAALGRIGDVYVMRLLDESDTDAAQTAAAVNGDPRVVYSHPNALGLIELHQSQINDPLVPLQWHLENRGDLGGRAGVDVKALEARDSRKTAQPPSGRLPARWSRSGSRRGLEPCSRIWAPISRTTSPSSTKLFSMPTRCVGAPRSRRVAH